MYCILYIHNTRNKKNIQYINVKRLSHITTISYESHYFLAIEYIYFLDEEREEIDIDLNDENENKNENENEN